MIYTRVSKILLKAGFIPAIRSIPQVEADIIQGFDTMQFCNDPNQWVNAVLPMYNPKYFNVYHLEYSLINGSFVIIGQSVRKSEFDYT